MAAIAGLSVVVRLLIGPIPADDAYITFRYSAHLAESGAFVYNANEPVLGTTTPLLTLLLAGAAGVVARIVTGPHDAHRQDPHLPIRYDTGRPSSVIRLRISQPRTTSLPCPAGLRARRPSPMMDL